MGQVEKQHPLLFNPGPNVTVDERLVMAFRVRCSFIPYMLSEPANCGIKIWAACDANNQLCIEHAGLHWKASRRNPREESGYGSCT